jgi:hypothetical protein
MIDFLTFVFFTIIFIVFYFIAVSRKESLRRSILLLDATLSVLFFAGIIIPDPTIVMPFCTQYQTNVCVSYVADFSGTPVFILSILMIILPFLSLLFER